MSSTMGREYTARVEPQTGLLQLYADNFGVDGTGNAWIFGTFHYGSSILEERQFEGR